MGTNRHENHTLSLGFARDDRICPDTALTRTASLSPDEPIPGTQTLTKIRKLFLGSSVASPFGCGVALDPEVSISVSGSENSDPISFRSKVGLSHVVVTSRFRTDFSDPLGQTDPCSTAAHMEPFSDFSRQGSHLSISYNHQDLHLRGLQASSRPVPSTLPAETLLRRKPSWGALPQRPGMVHFQG